MDMDAKYSQGALVTAEEMRLAEAAAMATGVPEEALMDAAGAGLAAELFRFLPRGRGAVIFAGKGHNAGDACAVAAHLLDAGWMVELRSVWPGAEWRPLAHKKWQAVRDRVTVAALEAALPPWADVLIDGLLGTGARGPLHGEMRVACVAMNRLRERHGLETFAIDLPSGLDPDTGSVDAAAVVADVTAALGFAKVGFVCPGAEDFTGRLAVVPLPGVSAPAVAAGRGALALPVDLCQLLPRRSFSMHKGQAGRVGIVAGSSGLTGAARLASMAACAAGGGLVTLFCPREVWPVLAATCPPEVMVKAVSSCLEVMDFHLDAIGIGPGMGQAPLPYLADLLMRDSRPVIVDADALNAMALGRISLAGRAGGARLLTPHPGEWSRLASAFGWAEVNELTESWRIDVLAKSARTKVHSPGCAPLYNTTGHPAMARGGMGDVLTGFLAASASQGMPLRDAAALGSWLLGRGAELALLAGETEASLTPTAVMRHATTGAFAELRRACSFS